MRQPPWESFPSPGRDDARAVRPDQPRARVAGHRAFHLNHVARGNPFGDANNDLQPGVHAFQNRIGGKGRGNKDGAGGGAGLLHRLGHRVEDRDAFSAMLKALSALAGRDAGDDLRAVINGKLGVFGAETAGDALDENFGVWFNENGHIKFSMDDLRFSMGGQLCCRRFLISFNSLTVIRSWSRFMASFARIKASISMTRHLPAGKFQFDGMFYDFIEIPDTKNLAQTIHSA